VLIKVDQRVAMVRCVHRYTGGYEYTVRFAVSVGDSYNKGRVIDPYVDRGFAEFELDPISNQSKEGM